VLAVLAAAVLAAGFVRYSGDAAPTSVTPVVEVVRELPPLRAYPTVEPADLAPGRPPFVQLKGFPPPPPAVRVSSGPVRRFVIPRLEIDHAIEVLSMAPTGELPTPLDANYRVGWYTDFGQPGTGGNALLTAHETWNHLQAPFFNLHRAVPGDEIFIDMADGRRLAYAVTSNIRYDVRSMSMNEIIWPSTRGSTEWITLITCGGRIVYDETGFGEYLDRDVVVARRIS
jgi:Sortase domain